LSLQGISFEGHSQQSLRKTKWYDTRSISSVKFEAHWATLKGSVMGLASLLDKEYETHVCNQVDNLKSRQILNTYNNKEVQLLHEWLRNKIFEFEVK
jgi:hypothetical protein